MKTSKHRAGDDLGIKIIPSLQDEVYLLMWIVFSAPVSTYRNPKTHHKYDCLSNQTLNPLNHENC